MDLDPGCKVRTPEGFSLHFYPASPARRMMAVLLDSGMVLAITSVLTNLAGLWNIFGEGVAVAFRILAGLTIGTLYWIIQEWKWNGRTFGKRLLRIQVVDVDGLELQLHQIVIRNVVRAVDFLPFGYFLGGLVAWCDSRGRRLGDLAGGTMVISSSDLPLPRYDEVENDSKYNSLCDSPLEAARLRDAVTPEESRLLAEALRRRPELNADARQELYSELASHFKAKVKFPEERLNNLSDENYLKNVANILFQN